MIVPTITMIQSIVSKRKKGNVSVNVDRLKFVKILLNIVHPTAKVWALKNSSPMMTIINNFINRKRRKPICFSSIWCFLKKVSTGFFNRISRIINKKDNISINKIKCLKCWRTLFTESFTSSKNNSLLIVIFINYFFEYFYQNIENKNTQVL